MNSFPPNKNKLSPTDLANIVDAAPVGMIISLFDGRFVYANPAIINMLGYSQDEIYHPDIIVSHPDDYSINQKIRQQLLNESKKVVIAEKRYLRKNGEALLALTSMTVLFNEANKTKYFVAQIIDIGEQKKIEKSVSLFRSMINSSREIMFIIDPATGKLLDSNIQGCESLGYTYQEIQSLSIFDIDINISKNNEWDKILATTRNTQNILFDGLHRCKDSSIIPVEISINYIVVDEIEYILALSRDVTERRKTEKIIWKQANYDPLTNLPNRNMLYDRLDNIISDTTSNPHNFAMLCLDLDNFKEVNDSLGHPTGDQLLIQVGERITNNINDNDIAGRLGGDEFCVLIDCTEDTDNVEKVAQNILSEISKPFHVYSHKIFISISIGISFFPRDASNVSNLFNHADQAMYAAKKKGKNCIGLFNQSMQKEAQKRTQLSRDLHLALQEQEFYIEYQPIFSIDNMSVEKAEALLRWKHPTLGIVSPTDFIAIAEENGTIDKIGDWIFSEVTQQIKIWKEKYNHQFQISINASPLYFREGNNILGRWQEKLNTEKLSGQDIVIEITEGLLLDTSSYVTNKLLMLRDAGTQVALDDFGTGYSSLAYLKKLDIDYLKIDKSFIDNLEPNSNEEALCEAIIVMAHKLKLCVIAEGIETEQQYQLIKNIGCDYGQGFLFSKPLSAKKFERLLTP